jgi:hypothetical protein
MAGKAVADEKRVAEKIFCNPFYRPADVSTNGRHVRPPETGIFFASRTQVAVNTR